MKSKVLLFLLWFTIILKMQGYSQPAMIRQHAYAGPGYNLFTDMKITVDSGLIIGGFTDAGKGMDKTEDSRGGRDYWLLKLDSTGRLQWDKTLGGYDEDDLTAIVKTRDYGYLIAGASESRVSGDKTQPNRGSLYDYWIIKIDSAGHKQWDKTIGGNFNDYLASADTTSDGGYILGGYSASPASGEKTSSYVGSSFNNDYWIVKLDSAGNVQWDKTIGGTGDDYLQDIRQTKDGGYIAGGTSSSGKSGNKTEDSRGGQDYWVVKLNTAGNVVWDKTLGGTDVDFLRIIKPTPDDSYIIGGTSYSDISGEKTHNSKGDADFWLVKIGADGEVLWDKTIGGAKEDWLESMQLTKDSGLIVSGSSFSGISGDKTERRRGTVKNSDYWVVKLNKNNQIQWDKTIGGSNLDDSYAILEYKRNNYIIGGTSYSGVSDDKTVPLKGNADYWIILLNYQKQPQLITLSSAIKLNRTIKPGNFTTYPNPVKNVLYVQAAGKVDFTLLDLTGKTILTKTISGNGQIPVTDLPAGIYYLQNNATNISSKVVITH